MENKKILVLVSAVIVFLVVLVAILFRVSKPTPPSIEKPISELTEKNALEWEVFTSDERKAILEDDFYWKKEGEASLRLETESGGEVVMIYKLPRGESLDLSTKNYLEFWAYSKNPNIGFQENSPWIVLRDAKGDFNRYQADWDILNESQDQWQKYTIPLKGDETWKLTSSGTLDLSSVVAVEIHADTWDYGFTLWIDGLRFY